MSHQYNPVTPEDVLNDGVDSDEFQGTTVRKGTIKACIENAKILQNENASATDKANALAMIQQLAPKVIAVELHRHVTWKDKRIQEIFDKEDVG